MRTFYDPCDHSYAIDGVRVPSVTQCLTLAGRIDDRWFTPEAADRGRRVHFYTVRIDRGLSLDGMPDDIAAEVEAYYMFKCDCRPVYRTIERAIFSAALRLGGRPDRTLRTLMCCDGGVLELKIGAEQEWHGEQLAGYSLIDPARGGPRWVVYLGKTGRYKLHQVRNSAHYARFREAVQTAHQAYGLAA